MENCLDRNRDETVWTSDEFDRLFCELLEDLSDLIAEKRGEEQYGMIWNDDVFQYHDYCWDESHCPWCHYPTTWQEPMLAGAKEAGADLRYASGVAPNFWHKPSGMKVWWYKSLGRQLRGVAIPSLHTLTAIMTECAERVRNSEVRNDA